MTATARPLRSIRFNALQRLVHFADDSLSLLEASARILNGWSWEHTPIDGTDAAIQVCRQGSAFRIEAPWLHEPTLEPDPVRAAGHFAVDLLETYMTERRDTLFLHCAAAEFDGRLVVFPGGTRAGKSTLMARLAAAATPVYTDDILAIEDGGGDRDSPRNLGVSLGAVPRVRLPLPRSARAALGCYVAGHRALGNRRYTYLGLPDGLGPTLGRRAPIGAIVLLDRCDHGPASIAPATGGDGLHALVLLHLGHGIASHQLVARLQALVGRLPCWRLRYSDVNEAQCVLAAAFPGSFGESRSAPPPAAPGPDSHVGMNARRSAARVYRRNSAVAFHSIDGDAFLVDAAGTIFRLNAVATGLWNLLVEPVSTTDAGAVLAEAFPDTEPSRIAGDTQRLVADLAENGLLLPVC